MHLFLRVVRKMLFLLGAALILVGAGTAVFTSFLLGIQLIGIMSFYDWFLNSLYWILTGLVLLELNLLIGIASDYMSGRLLREAS